MATYNELRLQQLLSPLNNQGTNNGIMGIDEALPFKSMVEMNEMTNNNQNYPELIQQLIENNKPLEDPFAGYNFQSIFPTSGIIKQAPSSNLDLSSLPVNMGVANEPDEEQEFLPDQKSSLKDSLSSMGRNFGISSLLSMISGNPILGLIGRGAKGLGALNDRMQNSDFGRSNTLADYFDARSYGGIAARNRKASQTMREARGIQKAMDMRGDSTSRISDRDISSVTRSSAAKSKGVGGGGYTASDSDREGYRGRY